MIRTKGIDDKLYLVMNLSFFDDGEKTEQPTSRKRNKAREEGQVARSQEVGTAFLFIAVFFSLRSFASDMFEKVLAIYRYGFGMISQMEEVFSINFVVRYCTHLFLQAVLIVMPIFAVSMTIGVIANLIQVGWHPTTKPLQPKFSRLNPISGFKRLFSARAIVELFKSLIKMGVILYVMYSSLKDEINEIPLLINMTLLEAVSYIGNLVIDVGLNVGMLFILVALVDYIYQRYTHTKSLKMTKQEVKEEFKNIEGNPQIKGKIRQKMREASMRRMMQQVPDADVIITNPTHYAVALSYDKDKAEAPLLVAKGADYLAKRIREKGAEHGVEIVENKELARTIYATVEVGREIPPELYQAVAEVLAFVYRLKHKTG